VALPAHVAPSVQDIIQRSNHIIAALEQIVAEIHHLYQHSRCHVVTLFSVVIGE